MKAAVAVSAAVGIAVAAAAAASVTGGSGAGEDQIRVAFFPNVGHIIPVVGLENGALQEIDGVRVVPRMLDSGPQAIESLFADSIDLAYVGPGPAINGFIKSQDRSIVILAGAASGGASLVAHPDSTIASVGDLAGARVAAPQVANTQDVSLRHHISLHGLIPAERGGSVHVLNIPNPEIYTLFAKGDIDAAWVPEPWATLLVEQLGGERLLREEELWPDGRFASVLLVARASYAEENPAKIQIWLESHKDIEAWINANPREAREIFSAYLERELGSSFSDEILDGALSNIEITSDPVADSLAEFARRADALGYLGRDGYNLDGIFYEPPDAMEGI